VHLIYIVQMRSQGLLCHFVDKYNALAWRESLILTLTSHATAHD